MFQQWYGRHHIISLVLVYSSRDAVMHDGCVNRIAIYVLSASTRFLNCMWTELAISCFIPTSFWLLKEIFQNSLHFVLSWLWLFTMVTLSMQGCSMHDEPGVFSQAIFVTFVVLESGSLWYKLLPAAVKPIVPQLLTLHALVLMISIKKIS